MPTWNFVQTGTTSSLCGVSVVNPQIVWASGSFDLRDETDLPGVVLRTHNGGKSWEDVTPKNPGAQALHFHDIEALEPNHAVVLAAGPGEDSRIYTTDDEGKTWLLAFQNHDPDAFYSGIAFFDHLRGLAVSDPVDGKFRILRTVDGGHTWQDLPPSTGMPAALDGEYVRATGTSLVTLRDRDEAWFGTVQTEGTPPPPSRVFHTPDRGDTWSAADAPSIPGGNPEFGMASLAFRDAQHGWALGGGWPLTVPETPSVVAETADGGESWSPRGTLTGFRFNMAWVPTNAGGTLVAVGRTGSDFSTDGGHTWQSFDGTDLRGIDCKLHVAYWAVGKDGKAAELIV